MRRLFIGLLVIAVLVIGGGVIANIAYQAGLSTAITTVAQDAPPGTIVTPVAPGPYGYGYGYGWHGPFGYGPGFSIFGFLGTLLVIFIVIGLLRALLFRGGGHRGWGGPGGWGGPNGGGERPWERHAHDLHESWHRESTDSPGPSSPTDQPPSRA